MAVRGDPPRAGHVRSSAYQALATLPAVRVEPTRRGGRASP
ncbi:hypothetical protein ACFSKW_43920 [Nonomuraea mangrovi]|uniref:Uncharacterized protein n=1 Tax=Nonomuraea mangrovi TaxID=2316207 RepID=A0ABW4TDJ8_9ACTN